MADEKDPPEGATGADPITNLPGWVKEKDDAIRENAEAEAQQQPAAPAQDAKDWRGATITGVPEYQFFEGKPVGELYNSYLHLNQRFQTESQRRAELERENEQSRRAQEADAAVQRVIGKPRQQDGQPSEDPRRKQIVDLWYTDPDKARDLQMELAREEAERIADEKVQAWRQSEASERWQQQSVTAGEAAVQYVAQQYGVTPEQAGRMVMATFTSLATLDDESVWANPNAYVWGVGQLYGEPRSQSAPPAPANLPEPAEPPGSKRPVVTQQRGTERQPLSREAEAARKQIARIAGFDEKRTQSFIEKGRRKVNA